MTPTRKESVYMSLADALARLSAGGEEELEKAHVSGAVTLVGRKREVSGWGPHTPIPPEVFAARVRFNLKENSIEADSQSKFEQGKNRKGEPWEHYKATADDFHEFEHAVRSSQWGYVKVAANELQVLKRSLSGRVISKSNAESDCGRWLTEQIRSNPRPKAAYKAEALGKFSISERAFNDRIWPSIAEQYGLSKPGRKKRPQTDNA